MTDEPRYDAKTMALHWLTAALVLGLWGLAQVIDFFPSGTPRVVARSTHILLGCVLVGVLGVRLAWRMSGGRQLPPLESGLMERASNAVHYALYALVAATLLLGLANTWIRGDNIFNLFRLPGYKPWREMVEDWHGTAANLVLILAGLHAAAALGHHFVLRDGVLRRMLPTKWL
jgi:cytochrome b561